MNTINTRRIFLKKTACVIAGVTAANLLPSVWANTSLTPKITNPITLINNENIKPLQMAKQSSLIAQSWHYLLEQIETVKNAKIRSLIKNIYNNPEPLVAKNLNITQRQKLFNALVNKGFTQSTISDFLPPIPDSELSFYAAPGGGYTSHHSYPGGLITHLATNVSITNALVDTYKNAYGYDVDRDIAVSAQLLHDLHKPWVFQWLDDNSYRIEQTLAGTGEHHILSAAELIQRQAPVELIIAMICAHQAPFSEKEQNEIAQWLEAAAIIADVDPVQYGLLTKEHKLHSYISQEGYICHLSDHDYILSVPAVKLTLPIIQKIAQHDYKMSESDLKSKKFNSLRNKFYSTYSAMYIHNIMVTEGEIGVKKLLNGLFIISETN